MRLRLKKITITRAVLAQWRKTAGERVYTNANPPLLHECTPEPGGLYTAPDGSLWEMDKRARQCHESNRNH